MSTKCTNTLEEKEKDYSNTSDSNIKSSTKDVTDLIKSKKRSIEDLINIVEEIAYKLEDIVDLETINPYPDNDYSLLRRRILLMQLFISELPIDTLYCLEPNTKNESAEDNDTPYRFLSKLFDLFEEEYKEDFAETLTDTFVLKITKGWDSDRLLRG